MLQPVHSVWPPASPESVCVRVCVCVIQPSHVQTHTVVLKSHRRETIGGLRWILSVLGTLLGSYRVMSAE